MYNIFKEALYLLQPDFDSIINNASKYHPNLTAELFLNTLCKIEYSLYRELGISESSCTRLLKKIFPNKVSCEKAHTYILSCFELKYCSSCKNILPMEDFSKNKARNGTVNSWCRKCSVSNRTEYQREYQATVRARKLQRSPRWADSGKIKEIYANCPKGYHVDHIVPLKGELVSGLHVENNLQYLLADDNIKKNNKFIV